MVIVSNTVLHFVKPTLPSRGDRERLRDCEENISTLFLISNPFITFGFWLFIATLGVRFISAEKFALFLSLTLVLKFIEDGFIFYYIYRTPHLKRFIIQSYRTSKTKVLLGYIYFIIETAYDCFVFFFFLGLKTHWPKRKDLQIPRNATAK